MRLVSQRPTRCPLRVVTSSPTMTSMGRPRPAAMARAATRRVDALVVGDGDGVQAPGHGRLQDGLHVRDAVRGQRVDVRVHAQQGGSGEAWGARRGRRGVSRLTGRRDLRPGVAASDPDDPGARSSLTALPRRSQMGKNSVVHCSGRACDDALEGARLLLDDGARGLASLDRPGAGRMRHGVTEPLAGAGPLDGLAGRWARRSARRARPARWAAAPGAPKSSTATPLPTMLRSATTPTASPRSQGRDERAGGVAEGHDGDAQLEAHVVEVGTRQRRGHELHGPGHRQLARRARRRAPRGPPSRSAWPCGWGRPRRAGEPSWPRGWPPGRWPRSAP